MDDGDDVVGVFPRSLLAPLTYINLPKVLDASEACHLFNTTNIHQKRTAARLQENIGKYVVRARVSPGDLWGRGGPWDSCHGVRIESVF
jgi:hypothetical protein